MNAMQSEYQQTGVPGPDSAGASDRGVPSGRGEPMAPGRGPFQAAGANPAASRRKSPATASLLSIFPGLGQIYVGYYMRGFLHLLVVAGVITLLANYHGYGAGPRPMLGMFLAFFWIYSIIDAGRLASLYNDVVSGLTTSELQNQFALPSRGGSIAAGVVLLVIGFLLFLNTMFDVSLDWVAEWWPLLPFGLGVYLVVQGIRDRRRKQ